MTQIWGFYDFDNTLMATEKLAVPSLVARFNELYRGGIGRDLTVNEFFKNFKGQARESLCANLSDYFKIYVDYPTLYEDREWRMMQHLQKEGAEMAPNLIEAFAALKKEGVKSAFVSNNPIQRALAAMRYATNGRGDELARFFGSNYFEAGDKQKPQPDVYLRAIAQTGADITRSFAVEDSKTGILSSVAAGLKTFGFTGFAENQAEAGKTLMDNGAIACFNDWGNFPALLEKYMR